MKYRRKIATEVEAFEFDGDLINSNGEPYVPEWAIDAFNYGILYFDGEPPTEFYLRNEDECFYIEVGDYIIKDIYGEIYPCKHDIFKEVYEEVKE
jgi:hypothetical protein